MEIDNSSAAALEAAMGQEGDRVTKRFARGCRAFAVTAGGEVAGYGWMSTASEWIGELNVEISPAAGEAYVWNCFTLAPHRRRGMYRALLEGIIARAGADGLRRLWIGSVEDPAEKADADAGFRPVLHLTVTRVGPIRRLRAEPAPAAAPDLALDARRRLGLRTWSTVGPARSRIH